MLPRLMHTSLAAAAALWAVAGPLAAQVPDTTLLVPGARVRVTTNDRSLRQRAGSIVSADSSSFALSYWSGSSRDTVRVAWDAIAEVEVSRGRRSSVGKGMLVGGLLGAVVGVATYEPCEPSSMFCFGLEMNLLAGGGVGLIAGALVGLVVRSERWEPRSGPGGVVPTLTVAPRGGGIRVGFSTLLPVLRR
jgi:hypothetical protein